MRKTNANILFLLISLAFFVAGLAALAFVTRIDASDISVPKTIPHKATASDSVPPRVVSRPTVYLLEVNGVINPASAGFIVVSLRKSKIRTPSA